MRLALALVLLAVACSEEAPPVEPCPVKVCFGRHGAEGWASWCSRPDGTCHREDMERKH